MHIIIFRLVRMPPEGDNYFILCKSSSTLRQVAVHKILRYEIDTMVINPLPLLFFLEHSQQPEAAAS